jgi:hypothetical protein
MGGGAGGNEGEEPDNVWCNVHLVHFCADEIYT